MPVFQTLKPSPIPSQHQGLSTQEWDSGSWAGELPTEAWPWADSTKPVQPRVATERTVPAGQALCPCCPSSWGLLSPHHLCWRTFHPA